MTFDEQFDSVFAPARPAQRQILGRLSIVSYAEKRDEGMAPEMAARILNLDPDIAEMLYQDLNQTK